MDTETAEVPTELMRTLPGSAYLSDEAYRREQERIFYREWLCVGREEALPSPGDFLNVNVVGESVLVVRARAGGLRAFYNVCRHRGSRLVIEDPRPDERAPACPSGRFKGSITCPYHSWTYALEGELRNAPFLTEGQGLRKAQLSLHPVGVEAWGGFVFVNLSPAGAEAEGRTLARQLGDVPERVQRYPLAGLRTTHRITYEVGANWKCIVENYNECYHCGPVHPELCEVVPAFKVDGGANLDWDKGSHTGRGRARSPSRGRPTARPSRT